MTAYERLKNAAKKIIEENDRLEQCRQDVAEAFIKENADREDDEAENAVLEMFEEISFPSALMNELERALVDCEIEETRSMLRSA